MQDLVIPGQQQTSSPYVTPGKVKLKRETTLSVVSVEQPQLNLEKVTYLPLFVEVNTSVAFSNQTLTLLGESAFRFLPKTLRAPFRVAIQAFRAAYDMQAKKQSD